MRNQCRSHSIAMVYACMCDNLFRITYDMILHKGLSALNSKVDLSSRETRSGVCIYNIIYIYKERARFTRSLLAPIFEHIAYFTHINLAYIASSVDMRIASNC